MTAVSGEQWTKWAGQSSWNTRTAGTGQPGQDRVVRTGHLGQDIWDQTTGTGQQRQVGPDKSA